MNMREFARLAFSLMIIFLVVFQVLPLLSQLFTISWVGGLDDQPVGARMTFWYAAGMLAVMLSLLVLGLAFRDRIAAWLIADGQAQVTFSLAFRQWRSLGYSMIGLLFVGQAVRGLGFQICSFYALERMRSTTSIPSIISHLVGLAMGIGLLVYAHGLAARRVWDRADAAS